jgi:hypothetical protein
MKSDMKLIILFGNRSIELKLEKNLKEIKTGKEEGTNKERE